MENDLIRYGQYLSDCSVKCKEGWKRFRIIKLDGRVYHHVMLNGEVIELVEITKVTDIL